MVLSPPCENLSPGVSIQPRPAPPVQAGRGLEQLVHPSAVCSPWLYLLVVGIDACDRQVQWWRGVPDFGSRGPEKRKPNRPSMAGPHLRRQQHGFSAPHLRLEAEDEALE